MKYTIGTDSTFAARHLMTLDDCMEHGKGYLELDGLEMLTFVLGVASAEFERAVRDTTADSTQRLHKEDPRYGAISDLQVVLRKAFGQLDELI